jgi:hypothetical protein
VTLLEQSMVVLDYIIPTPWRPEIVLSTLMKNIPLFNHHGVG